jgi:uncharacterized delta-60 repeat protein
MRTVEMVGRGGVCAWVAVALGLGLALASGCDVEPEEDAEASDPVAAQAAAATTTCTDPGCLDSSFSGNGQLVRARLGYQEGGYRDVAVLPRGTVAAVGEASPFGDASIVVHFYTAAGARSGYGTDGETRIGGVLRDFRGFGIAASPGNALAVAGRMSKQGELQPCEFGNADCEESFLVARLGTDGKLDRHFGGDGVRTFRPSTYPWNEAHAAVFQSSGEIVAVGHAARLGADGRFYGTIARLAPDGSSALAGSSAGFRILPHPTGWENEILTDVAVQSDDKIVTVGVVFGTSRAGGAFVRRFNADGSVDDSFGEHLISDGRVSGGGGKIFLPRLDGQAIAVDAGDRIVVGGTYVGTDSFRRPYYFDTLDAAEPMGVTRLSAMGRFDASYGDQGYARILPHDGILGIVTSLAVERLTGRVVFAGRRVPFTAGARFAQGVGNLVVGRLTSSGRTDTTFGHGDGVAALLGVATGGLSLAGSASVVVSGITCGSDSYCGGLLARYLLE